MFSQIFATTPTPVAVNDENAMGRRKAVRFQHVRADVMFGAKRVAVKDWSTGGVLFETPRHDWNAGGAFFDDYKIPQIKKGENIKVSLRFYVLGDHIDIAVDAKVLRSDASGTAVKFLPMTMNARRRFDSVIDAMNTESFMQSQTSAVFSL